MKFFRFSTMAAGALLAKGEVYRADDAFDRLEPIPVQFSRKPGNSGFSARSFSSPTGQVFSTSHGIRIMQDVPEDKTCDYYPEVVLVQDVTDSFKDDIKSVTKILPSLFDMFKQRFDGKVKFGMVTFTDKTIQPWGGSGEWCAQLEFPLEVVTDDFATRVVKRLKNMTIKGGGDWLDGANEGLVRAAVSDTVGWSDVTATHDAESGRPIVRIIILVTDAAIHEDIIAQQENSKLKEPLPAQDFGNHPEILAKSVKSKCKEYDYPSVDSIRNALNYRNITPIVLAGSPTYWASVGDGKPEQRWFWDQYESEFLDRYSMRKTAWDDLTTGLAAFYGDYFTKRVGLDTIVQYLEDDSSNFMDAVEEALNEVSGLTCIRPDQTTAVPVDDSSKPTEPHSDGEGDTTVPEGNSDLTGPHNDEEGDTTVPGVNSDATGAHNDEDGDSTVTAENSDPTEPHSDGDDATVPAENSEPSQGSDAPETSSTSGDDGYDSPSDYPNDTTAGGAAGGGSNTGVVVGAAGGGAAAAAAAGVLLAKKMGLLFNNNSTPDMNVTQDVDHVEGPQDREQFEAVTGDLFS